VQVFDDLDRYQGLRHREVGLNIVARKWSQQMVAKLMRIPTIYDK
jgi:hypothetical protein